MKTQKDIDLSVIISALNEQDSVQQVLTKILEILDESKLNGEIIFMDNHSTDKTGQLADEISKKDKRVRVIHRINRPSKDLGSSIIEGLSNAKGQYITMLDCDISHDAYELLNFLKHKDEADIIVGSRKVKGGSANMPLKRKIMSNSYMLVSRILVGVKVKDFTGSFKLYNRKVFDNMHLTNQGFGLFPEIVFKAYLQGFTFKELPIQYAKSSSASNLNYKKQFRSYAEPLLKAFKARLLGKKNFKE